MPAHDREQQEEHCCRRAHASREAVHVVQQVQGIGDAHHPEDGNCQIQRLAGQSLHLHPRGDEDERRGNLAGQLDQRPQAEAVIPQAHEGAERSPQENADDLLHIEAITQDGQGHNEGKVDGCAPKKRGRAGVHLARCGLVNHAKPYGQFADERRHAHCQDKGAKQDEQILSHCSLPLRNFTAQLLYETLQGRLISLRCDVQCPQRIGQGLCRAF